MNLSAKKITVNGVQYWEVNIPQSACGQRKRIRHATREATLTAARQFLADHQTHGSEFSDLTSDERAFIVRMRRTGVDLGILERHAPTCGARSTMKLVDAFNEYLKTQAGNSRVHITGLKSCFKAFAAAYPNRTLASITSADIYTYLKARKSNERAIFRRLGAFLRWARIMRFVTENPMEMIPKPDPDNKERVVFNLDQMKTLLAAAADDPAVLRYLVLGGFFGLRRSEIERLQCEDINLEHMEIHVRNMKTAKRGLRERYVAVTPEAIPNGRAWLESLNLPKSGPVIPLNGKNFQIHRNAVIAKANGDDVKEAMKPVAQVAKRKGKLIEWPFNGLRRSFASYHLVAFDNQNLTASLMGHTTSDTTFAKYRAVRRKADGEAWFALLP